MNTFDWVLVAIVATILVGIAAVPALWRFVEGMYRS
jgi:hypothetical protein